METSANYLLNLKPVQTSCAKIALSPQTVRRQRQVSTKKCNVRTMPSDFLENSNILPEYRDTISTQEYSQRTEIEGVRLIDLKLFNDDGGSFVEIARITDGGYLEGLPEFQVRQTSYSLVLPGSVKAFHLHYRQDDVWFVPPNDRLLAGLIDVRAESPTKGVRARLVLGAGRPQLLFIPRGVAHGVANLWATSSSIFYYVSQQFNLSDPDERRLPHDSAGEHFWEIKPG
jgi:dTDP-4-dehydrorhamnose 3,5-epimerase